MRDPAGADQAAALDARHRGGVPRDDGKPEIRAERLGHRAHLRPVPGPRRRLTKARAGTFCDVAGMVILQHEHIRKAAQDGAQLCRAHAVERTAKRVLRTGSHDARGGAGRPRGATGPWPATVVPWRPAATTSPRVRSSRYADATVAALTPSRFERERTVGRRVPRPRPPSRMPRSMLPAMSLARFPLM